ncbi:MAG TPA: hypothetical protein ENH51_05455 [Euryarchaeota archaeon]|nr:hypothetical protein [Euryarchaeota archaeon]
MRGAGSRRIYFIEKLWNVSGYKITISDMVSNIFSMAFETSSPRRRSAPEAQVLSPLKESAERETRKTAAKNLLKPIGPFPIIPKTYSSKYKKASKQ